jgi:type VI secretion system ImpM family protein
MGKPVVTALGKVRVEAEFIGHANGQPHVSFAQWLDEGVGHAVDQGGAAWRDLFRRSGPQAFLYRAPPKIQAKSVLLGVLGPSEDSFSRPFPFAVMTDLRESSYAGGASSLPVASERFVAEAADVCRAAPATRRAADILERVQEVRPPNPQECDGAGQDFMDWQAQDGIVTKLWPLLFPSGAPGAERCFRQLIDTVVPMRTHGAIGTCRAVRLPLGGGGAVAVSFWLDVVRALAQWSRTIPAVFWPAERSTGSVLIQLGEVPASSFGELWAGTGDPLVVDLTGPDVLTPPDVPPLSVGVARALAEPRARVRALLDALGNC